MSTATRIINRIFENEGAAAAAARAELIGELNIARKIRAGQWNQKPVANASIPLGSKGDISLFAIKRDGLVVRIVKQTMGESGNIVSAETLDTIIIAEAMKVLA